MLCIIVKKENLYFIHVWDYPKEISRIYIIDELHTTNTIGEPFEYTLQENKGFERFDVF